MGNTNSIFVAIPSFRDPECIHTLDDLYAKATNPNMITVGVCDQYHKVKLSELLEEKSYKSQVRIIEVPCEDAKGSSWAWSQAHSLMKDEEFTLNIHAHMRFIEGWDEEVIEQYNSCPSDRAVLSGWCPPYKPPNDFYKEPNGVWRIRVKKIGEPRNAQLVHLDYDIIGKNDLRHGIHPSPFIVFNFVFTKSDVFKQLPIDPYIFFWGEEMSYSARLWTHGYDVFQPSKTIAFHQWSYRDIGTEHRPINHPGNRLSYQRLCKLFDITPDNGFKAVEGAEESIDDYSLGHARSLKDWFQFAGVSFVERTVSDASKAGFWGLSVVSASNKKQPTKQPSIFVALPSYLDPQCVPTIKRIFESAAHPKRVMVGVCWQTNKQVGGFPYHELTEWEDQLHVIEVDIADAKGANWARNQALQLQQGEDYALLMDAHMYMLDGWDDSLINSHKELGGGKKLVLTYYCPPFDPPNQFASATHSNRRVIAKNLGKEGDPQLVHLNREVIKPSDPRFNNYYPSPFIVHHFIFTRMQAFEDIPIDPNIRFWGDELTLSLRFWTHGYLIYQLPNKPAYHQWNQRGKYTPIQNYRGINNQRAKRDTEYVKMALGLEHQSDQALQKQYRLGKERPVEGFWQYSGVDLKGRKISEHGKNGLWDLSVLKGQASAQKPKAETYLAQAQKTAKVAAPKQNIKGNMASTTSHEGSLLVCISASDNDSLGRSLTSLINNASNISTCKISVAWYGHGTVNIPEPLSQHIGETINVQHVAGRQMVANAFKDATASWNKEDYIAFTKAGCEFVAGWDKLLHQELKKLKSKQLITAIVGDDGKPARIAATAASLDNQAMLVEPTAISESEETSQQTPLISFDLLAGKAENIFTCLPDPYMDLKALEMSHAARLWTHGFVAMQPKKQILSSAAFSSSHEGSKAMAQQRVQHMLGLRYTEQETILIDLDQYGHGEEKEVDSFWRAVGVNLNNETIHPKALKGEWGQLIAGKLRLNSKQMKPIATAHPPVQIADSDYKDAKIFVQIASYRDAQCQYTVQDLFAKAKYPDRVTVGIVWQSVPEEDQECFRIVTRPEQVRVTHFDARESKGACWARHHGQKLWQGEEFTLQIDSHMRFEEHWDELLLNMYESIGRKKAVLTTYPPGYTPPDKLAAKAAHRLAAKEFNQQGIMTMSSKRINTAKRHTPVPGAFASACMLFGPSSFIEDVPYDPYLYFFGEEITLSVRLWTHGYDIYHPNKHTMWHDWKRENRKTTHFKDHDWQQINRKSYARVRFLLAGQNPQKQEMREYVRQEIDTYGLGKERSLRAYETYAGVSFANRVITDRASRGDFSSEPPYSEQQSNIVSTQPAAANNNSSIVEPFENAVKPILGSKSGGSPIIQPHIIKNNGPIKTLETPEIIVYDDFLPEEHFEKIYEHAVMTDYKHINTTGNVSRVWNIDNGFPLRSSWNRYYRVPGIEKKTTEHDYPVDKPTDRFVDRMNQISPEVQHLVGAPSIHWSHFSITSWLYPQNTGLSLHNDGSGVYSGAYVYYLNKEWRIHWGGILMVMDSVANQAMEDHKMDFNPHRFHRGKWLHETEHDEYVMEAGFGRAVFPKRNRIVFIAPTSYHIVTKVLPAAGDNVRMTLAGFFNRGPLQKQNQNQPKPQTQHPLEVLNKTV